MTIQIQEWHGDTRQDIEARDAEEAATIAAKTLISEAAAYDRIGGKAITVKVDDGHDIITWDVMSEYSVHYSAKQR